MEYISTIKPIIDLLSALTSPIVAITVAYIAYQQWKINAKKAFKETQKEKLEIYMAVKRFLHHFDTYQKIDQKLYSELHEAIALADFLFDKEVTDWLFNVDIEASSWLDTTSILEEDKDMAPTDWVLKQKAYVRESRDKLQNAHCELFEVFKNKIVQTKA